MLLLLTCPTLIQLEIEMMLGPMRTNNLLSFLDISSIANSTTQHSAAENSQVLATANSIRLLHCKLPIVSEYDNYLCHALFWPLFKLHQNPRADVWLILEPEVWRSVSSRVVTMGRRIGVVVTVADWTNHRSSYESMQVKHTFESIFLWRWENLASVLLTEYRDSGTTDHSPLIRVSTTVFVWWRTWGLCFESQPRHDILDFQLKSHFLIILNWSECLRKCYRTLLCK